MWRWGSLRAPPVATTTLHAAGQLDHCQRAWTCTGISAAQVRTRRDVTLSAYTKAAISIRIATPVWQVVEVATPWWDCDTEPRLRGNPQRQSRRAALLTLSSR